MVWCWWLFQGACRAHRPRGGLLRQKVATVSVGAHPVRDGFQGACRAHRPQGGLLRQKVATVSVGAHPVRDGFQGARRAHRPRGGLLRQKVASVSVGAHPVRDGFQGARRAHRPRVAMSMEGGWRISACRCQCEQPRPGGLGPVSLARNFQVLQGQGVAQRQGFAAHQHQGLCHV